MINSCLICTENQTKQTQRFHSRYAYLPYFREKMMVKSQHNCTVFNWRILPPKVTRTGHQLYFVANRMSPETTLCVKQTTTDVRFGIIKIKVNVKYSRKALHRKSFDSIRQLEHFMTPAQLVNRQWKTALLSLGWCWHGFIQPILIFPTTKRGCPSRKAITYRRSLQLIGIDCNEEDILSPPGVTVYLVTHAAVLMNKWT